MSTTTPTFDHFDAFSAMQESLQKIRNAIDVPALSTALQAIPKLEMEPLVGFRGLFETTKSLWSETISASMIANPSSLAPIMESTKELWATISASAILSDQFANTLNPTIQKINACLVHTPISELCKIATEWSWVADAYMDFPCTPDVDDMEETAIPEDVQSEMAQDLEEVFSNPETAAEVAHAKVTEWKKKHPGWAYFFFNILIPWVITTLLSAGVSQIQGIINRPTRMYEEPVSSSNVVINIDVDQNVTVVNAVPYYYEVQIVDPVSGGTFTGYIYKPNVDISQDTPQDASNKIDKPSRIASIAENPPIAETK